MNSTGGSPPVTGKPVKETAATEKPVPIQADTAKRVPVAVLVSGNGSNLQALLDAERSGRLGKAFVAVVISDRSGAYALERAKQAGKPALIIEANRKLPKEERRLELSNRILAAVQAVSAECIVLAGFLSILQGPILEYYRERIINIHPSLLPKFGGPGMYGERVHRAVLDAEEPLSGCTVHIVDHGTDTGPILIQRTVPVLGSDTPDSLAHRIHIEEHVAIVDGLTALLTRLGYTTKGTSKNLKEVFEVPIQHARDER